MSEKAALTAGFLKRKMQEYELLQAEIKASKTKLENENGDKPSTT
jgi:hypothetical protein